MQRHLLVKGMVSGNQFARMTQAVHKGASVEKTDSCIQVVVMLTKLLSAAGLDKKLPACIHRTV